MSVNGTIVQRTLERIRLKYPMSEPDAAIAAVTIGMLTA